MSMDPTEKSYTIAYKKCSELVKATSQPDVFALFQEFMQLVHPTQPALVHVDYVSVVAGADQERHALQAHGYTGPLYHDQILQKAGFSLDADDAEVQKSYSPTAVDRKIAASVATYKECMQKGVRPPDVHIGPGAAGEDFGEMMKAFRNMRLHLEKHPDAKDGSCAQTNLTLHLADMLNV